MKTNKWLVFSIVFLSLSILVSGFWIGKSMSAVQETTAPSVPVISVNPDILTISEAAAFLKISEGKLKELVENSKMTDGEGIPYYKMDQTLYFSKTTLAAWVVRISTEHHEY